MLTANQREAAKSRASVGRSRPLAMQASIENVLPIGQRRFGVVQGTETFAADSSNPLPQARIPNHPKAGCSR